VRVFAVVPALLVLVSPCGSPVPRPPGTVSGTVYYDANHNGIHDSCDSPLGRVNVQATGSDGKSETATADADGNFRIDKVPSGATTITLQASHVEVWPLTTGSISVTVKGPMETSGIEIGSASWQSLPKDVYTVIGVIYNDANGNGQIDAGECGISGAQAWEDTSQPLQSPSPSGSPDGSFSLESVSTPGPIHPFVASERAFAWLPTKPVPGQNPCSDGVVPKPGNANGLFEADIGFQQTAENGEITGVVFDDANANGVRDAGEEGIPGVTIRAVLAPHNCGNSTPVVAQTDADGGYAISHLTPGTYEASIHVSKSVQNNLVVAGWTVAPTVTVGNSAPAVFDLPAKVVPSGDVTVVFFSDTNRDGVREDGERAMPGVKACLENSANAGQTNGNGAPANPQGDGTTNDPTLSPCATSDRAGDAALGPVPAGDYGIVVNGGSEPESPPPPVHVDGPSGVSVQTAMPPLQIQVVPPGVGTNVPLNVCYSDDTWTQRLFKDGYDRSASFYAAWNVNESLAQTMYAEGIYQVSVPSPDTYVWSAIAGLSWRQPPTCPANAGNASPTTSTFVLYGFKAVAAVQSGD
jgi:hypothetical protein